MFPFFHQKNNAQEEVIDTDRTSGGVSSSSVKSEIIPQETVPDDDMAKDLAVLIGKAITTWEKKYGLENLPYDIALDQAISIMVTARDALKK